MANTIDAVSQSSIHSDPNFSVICSFLTRYGSLMGLIDISFEQLEKWINDTRNVNGTFKDLLIRLLKRWKSSVNEDRLQQYLIKFCYTYSQYDAWEVEGLGFERCKTETKLRILKNLLEFQFDVNVKFKEKVNEIPAADLRSQPLGRDVNGKAYWFLADNDMNIRIYSEEQDDVENETWQIIVSDRNQLANLISSLEQQKAKQGEKSSSTLPSTEDDGILASTPGDRTELGNCNSCSDAVPSGIKTEDDISIKNSVKSPEIPLDDRTTNGLSNLSNVKVKLEQSDEKSHPCVKQDSVDENGDGSSENKRHTDLGETTEAKVTSSLTIVSFDKNTVNGDHCHTDLLLTADELDSGVSLPDHSSDLVQRDTTGAKDLNPVTLQPVKTCDNKLCVENGLENESDSHSKNGQHINDLSDSVATATDTKVTDTKVANHCVPATAGLKLSNKRKRTSIIRTLSTSSEDTVEPAVALSESELSESSVPNSSNSAGEEPPMKRKREKALRTASQRDKISNRIKNGLSHESPSSVLTAKIKTKDSECPVSPNKSPTKENSEGSCESIVHVVTSDKKTSDDQSADVEKHREVVNEHSGKEVVNGIDDTGLVVNSSEKACSENGTASNSADSDGCVAALAERVFQTDLVCTASIICASENSKKVDDQKQGTCESFKAIDDGEVNGTVWDKRKEEGQKVRGDSETNKDEEGCNECEKINVSRDMGDLTEEVKIVISGVLDKLDADSNVSEGKEPEEKENDEEEQDKSSDTIVFENPVSLNSNDVVDKELYENLEENSVDASEKGITKKPGRRGRKKRGRPAKTPSQIKTPKVVNDTETCSEQPKKIGRPRKTKPQLVLPEEQENETLSEDDIPLIELRRSSRANKGVRSLEQIVVEQSKKRIRKEEAEKRKQAEREEEELRKQEEERQQHAVVKTKKKKRCKTEVDDDFVPGKKTNSKGRVKGRGSKAKIVSDGETEESDGTDEIDELFEPESEEEILQPSESTDDQLESDGSEYVPRGRNAKRAAAIKQKEVVEEVIEDNPCQRCGKSDQPEWLLLCDRCDAGYHSACLRPPIMVIPEADWFCPLCEHTLLIEKLHEQLSEYDKKAQQNFRLIQRKERLAFVSVNVTNIITKQERRLAAKLENSDIFDNEATDANNEDTDGEGGDGENVSESAEEKRVKKRVPTSRPRTVARRRRHSYSSSASNSETEYSSEEERTSRAKRLRKPKRRVSERESSDEEDEDDWGRRPRRSRKQINYKFQEFDELISGAIEDDVKSPTTAHTAPARSRGKDMSNIIGVCESSNDKPPANKRKKRNLTQLDSNDEDQEDDSEEYQLSNADEPSSADDDEFVDNADSEDTDDWKISRRSSMKKPSRSSNRTRRQNRYSDFVNDDSDEGSDYSDDEWQRRTRRCVAQRRVNYHEVSNSDSDSLAEKPKKVAPVPRSKTRCLRNSDSEYHPSTDGEEAAGVALESVTRAEALPSHKRVGLGSDNSGSEAVSKKKGRLNRIVSSSESENTDHDDDKEQKPKSPVDKNPVADLATDRVSVDVVEQVVNGKSNRDVSVVNCNNAESLNNRSFAIVNLLRSTSSTTSQSSKHCVSDSVSEQPVKLVAGDEDSLSGIEDLVDYVTQL